MTQRIRLNPRPSSSYETRRLQAASSAARVLSYGFALDRRWHWLREEMPGAIASRTWNRHAAE